MKTNQRDGRKSKAGRIVVFVMIGLALTAAVLLPVYQVRVAAQALDSANSLRTRIVTNPNGSVTVSFLGVPGTNYQIYYSDSHGAPPQTMQWTLAADDLLGVTNEWTEWLDAGGNNRAHPSTVQERYYRVIVKLTSTEPQPLLPITSTFRGWDPLQVSKLQEIAAATQLKEIAELGRLAAGGEQTEAELIQRLSQKILTVAQLIELGRMEEQAENMRAAQLIFEAVLGPRFSEATRDELALAHFGLGNIYGRDNLQPVESIAEYLIAAELGRNTWTEWESLTAIGQLYRLQKRYPEARSYWVQIKERAGISFWPEYAQWFIGLSYHEEHNFTQSLAEFQVLAAGYVDKSWQADGQYWVGEALRELGRYEEAQLAYEKVAELKSQLPQDSPFLFNFELKGGWTKEQLADIAPHIQPKGEPNQ